MYCVNNNIYRTKVVRFFFSLSKFNILIYDKVYLIDKISIIYISVTDFGHNNYVQSKHDIYTQHTILHNTIVVVYCSHAFA